MGYIYSILNVKTNKSYIGQTKKSNLELRIKKHFQLLRANNHFNQKLQNSYNKYGEDSFIYFPLCECDDSELNHLECLYIELFDVINQGYNICKGGAGIISEESQKKNKETNQNKWDDIYKINPQNLEIVEVYPSQNEAARLNNVALSAVNKSCIDKGRIVKGFIYLKSKDYTKNWKPHIRVGTNPVCIINNENKIIGFYISKKEAVRDFDFKNIAKLDRIVNSHKEVIYNNQRCNLVYISQKQYYEYDIGTCIDYPR